jgi:hypothetical protein
MRQSEKQWNNQSYSFYLSNFTHFSKSQSEEEMFRSCTCKQNLSPGQASARRQGYATLPPVTT